MLSYSKCQSLLKAHCRVSLPQVDAPSEEPPLRTPSQGFCQETALPHTQWRPTTLDLGAPLLA